MLDTPCSEVVWRVLATHSIAQFPLHFPSRASPCAITFQLESSYCVGVWADPRTGVALLVKTKIHCPCRGTILALKLLIVHQATNFFWPHKVFLFPKERPHPHQCPPPQYFPLFSHQSSILFKVLFNDTVNCSNYIACVTDEWVSEWVSVKHCWNDNDRVKAKCLEKNLFQCHYTLLTLSFAQ
jgi:hypothetical protein